jgi:hypothetical protein
MNQTTSNFIRLVSASLFAVATAAADASLIGDQIYIDRLIPSREPPFSFCESVLGSGPDGCAVTVTDGQSDRLALTTGNNLYVNVEASQIRFEFGPDFGAGGFFDEHLIVFNDLDFLGTNRIISGVAVDTDLVGMDASRISFSHYSVVVNYANISYSGGQYLILTLQTSPLPEPSTLAFVGFAGLCLAVPYRKMRG